MLDWFESRRGLLDFDAGCVQERFLASLTGVRIVCPSGLIWRSATARATGQGGEDSRSSAWPLAVGCEDAGLRPVKRAIERELVDDRHQTALAQPVGASGRPRRGDTRSACKATFS